MKKSRKPTPPNDALPAELYVQMVDHHDEGEFSPHVERSFLKFQDGAEIGLYRLVEKRTKRIIHSLGEKS